MRKPINAYCRSLYMRKDGSLYVQAGHDKIQECFTTTEGTVISIRTPANKVLEGYHCETKKCGIVLSHWTISDYQEEGR